MSESRSQPTRPWSCCASARVATACCRSTSASPEASSIHYALEGVTPPRPLTHDLFLQTLEVLGARVERVVVTDMIEHTYYAELHLQTAAGAKVDLQPAVRRDRPGGAL